MAAPNRGIAAGAQQAFLGFYDENGLLTGGTPTAPTNGVVTGNPFAHILGIKEASPEVGEPETEVITGDDIRMGEFDFDSIATRRFTITVAAFNLQQEADILGTNVESIAGFKLGAIDVVDRVERDCCIIINSRTKKQDVGTMGQKAWSGLLIPLATVIPLHRQTFSERTGAVYRLSVTPQVAGNDAWGITYTEALAGTEGLTYRPFSGDYPMTIGVFSGDGIVTAWTLKHKPVDTNNIAVYMDKVARTVSSVSTTLPYSVTTSSALRAGGRIIVPYGYQDFTAG